MDGTGRAYQLTTLVLGAEIIIFTFGRHERYGVRVVDNGSLRLTTDPLVTMGMFALNNEVLAPIEEKAAGGLANGVAYKHFVTRSFEGIFTELEAQLVSIASHRGHSLEQAAGAVASVRAVIRNVDMSINLESIRQTATPNRG